MLLESLGRVCYYPSRWVFLRGNALRRSSERLIQYRDSRLGAVQHGSLSSLRIAKLETKGVTQMGTDMVVEMLEQQKAELENTAIGQRLIQLQQALAQLKGGSMVLVANHPPQDYSDLGPIAAATLWLREVGEARSTTEIAHALQSRGVKTNSGKFVASLHASLRNSKDFKRIGAGKQGKWELVNKGRR